MKPRISIRNSFGARAIWACVSWAPWRAGYGYTPEAAFREWEAS